MLLISVESAADRDVAFSRLEPFLSVISRGSWTIRVPSDWIAVPVVGGLHFLDFEEIVRILRRDASERCFVVDAERGGGDDPERYVQQFAPSIASLEATWAESSLNDFAVIPAVGDWLVLCSEEDFVIVIGEPDNVVAMVERPPLEAIAVFGVDAQDLMQPWKPRLLVATAIDWQDLPGGEVTL